MSLVLKGVDPKMSESDKRELMKEQLKNLKFTDMGGQTNGTKNARISSA